MKLLIEIDTDKDDPNAVGELLRGKFWDQSDGKIGCYSTFTYNKDVEVLPDEAPDENGNIIQQAKWKNILCRWFWDGDGFIEFFFDEETVLQNDDCKKNYRWEWV